MRRVEERGRRAAQHGLLVILALALATAGGPGHAQEAGEPPTQPEEEESGIALTDDLLPAAEGAGIRPLTIWATGRRAFQQTPTHIVAYDLDMLEEVARLDEADVIDEFGVGFTNNARFRAGLAVDQDGGLLFVPREAQTPAEAQGKFGGVFVVDAATLDVIGDLPFLPIGAADGTLAQPDLLAYRFEPPRTSEEGGKLLLVLHDLASRTVSDAPFSRAQIWVAQIDVETGAHDWLARGEVCGNMVGSTTHAVARSADPARPFVYLTCEGSGGTQWVVRLVLDDDGTAVLRQEPFAGPQSVERAEYDPVSERMLLRSQSGNAQTWWVFDGHRSVFLGQIGVGSFSGATAPSTFDPWSGKLFVFAPPQPEFREPGGLLVVDTRTDRVDQGVWLRGFADVAFEQNSTPPAVEPALDGRTRRLFFRPGATTGGGRPPLDGWLILRDAGLSFGQGTGEGEGDALDDLHTDDVPERPGATTAVFDGTARGYGLRVMLIRGTHALHNSSGDHTFYVDTAQDGQQVQGVSGIVESLTGKRVGFRTPCVAEDREFILGLAGTNNPVEPIVMDDLGSTTAQAVSAWADQATKDLMARPQECQELVDVGQELRELGVRGLDLPQFDWDQRFRAATCAAPDRPADAQGDDILLNGFTAEVTCEAGQEVTGLGRASLVRAAPDPAAAVAVTEAWSTARVERRAGGGLVGRVESVARGVSVVGEHGSVAVDEVRAHAEVWANGRSQPTDLSDDPNCDFDRSAGSCYRRTMLGVTVTTPEETFTCEQCEEPENQQQMAQAMQRALGSQWTVVLRDPDADLAAGEQNGALAAIQKPDVAKFADETLKNDLLSTVPALELVRVGDSRRGRTRAVYQFAGIEAGTTYKVLCLLTVVDGECVERPASLTIQLSDQAGRPLAGGVFNVATDTDGDGDIGVEETLLPPRTCTTTAGRCEFATMPTGAYVITQLAAPAGYVRTEESIPVTLPAGGVGSVTVVNGQVAVTGIAVTLSNSEGSPLPGGVFEIYADDGDHARSAGDVRVATCTTDAQGRCEFVSEVSAPEVIDAIVPPDELDQGLITLLTVPPGAYVIGQASAPAGYEPADDVGFDLEEGQVARANFLNGPTAAAGDDGAAPSSETPTQPPPATAAASEAPSAPAPPVVFEEAPPPTQPVVSVQQTTGLAAPVVAPSSQGPTTLVQIIQSPGDAARLLLRQPKEAAAFGGLTLLFGAAVAGAWRRRLILWLLAA